VISTNTINLQDQLFFKDIPALQKVMSDGADKPPFTAALLKGRSNYLCLKRYKDLRRDQRLMSDDVRALLKVQLWLPTTESGDRAELPLQEGENASWNRMSAAWEQCTGPRCSEFQRCFFFKARKQAEAAHLVIVNHALLMADLAVENDVIPPYDYLIIDEAHNLEDVATDQLSFNVDREGLLAFLDDIFTEGQAQVVGGPAQHTAQSFPRKYGNPHRHRPRRCDCRSVAPGSGARARCGVWVLQCVDDVHQARSRTDCLRLAVAHH